ncbi:MAG: hypothetical protein ABL928_06210 [Sphingorhabdus sp.]
MRRSLFFVKAAMALGTFTSPALAESSSTGTDAIKATAQSGTTGGTTSSSTFGTLAQAFQIESTGEDTTATVALSFNLSEPGQSRSLDTAPTKLIFGTTAVQISATAPLGKNGKPSLFDFDKLGDDTSLKFGLSHYWGAVNYIPASDANGIPARTSRLTRVCIAAESERAIANASQQERAKMRKDGDNFREDLNQKLAASATLSPQAALETIADQIPPTETSPFAKTLVLKCIEGIGGALDGTKKSLVTEYGTVADKANVDDWNASGLWFIGGNGKVARANYEFIDQIVFNKRDFSRTNYKIEAFGGHISRNGKSSWQGSLSYVRSYKPQDDINLCQPNGVGAQILCLTGAAGAPAQKNRYTAAIEYRHLFTLQTLGGSSLAIAPRISYEAKSKGALFDLPIYFAPDKSKGLNGGFRVGYDTAEDDLAFGLFVGLPFSLFY